MKRLIPLFCILFMTTSCSQEHVDHPFKVVAHQGYWRASAGASNSIRGLEESAALGIEGVELDVRQTVDDSLVLCHDAVHGKYSISASTFNQIREIKLPDGSLIPTFREYVACAKQYDDIALFIDVKDGECVKEMCSILNEQGMGTRAVFLASYGLLTQILETNCGAKVLIMDGNCDIQRIKESGANGLSVGIEVLKQKTQVIKEAHDLGLIVNAWVIKSESEIIWCSLHDIDYVTTDSPLECKHYLYQ